MNSTIKVSITDDIALKPKHVSKLQQNKKLDISYYKELPYGKAELIRRIGDAQIAIFDLITKVDKDVINQCSSLTCLITASTGYQNVDVAHASKKGITTCNCPDILTRAVAEFVFSMLISLSRRTVVATEMAKIGVWRFDLFKGRELGGKTLGVIGAGKIGKQVIQIGKGMGMNVLCHTANPNNKRAMRLGLSKFVSLQKLLTKSDFVSIHIPLSKKTYHFIGKKELAMMKNDAILINLSPYDIVNTKMLYTMLLDGSLGGAGFDGIKLHPKDFKKSPIYSLGLMNLPNVLITPDMAWYTEEGLERLAQTILLNIFSFAEGKPINVV